MTLNVKLLNLYIYNNTNQKMSLFYALKEIDKNYQMNTFKTCLYFTKIFCNIFYFTNYNILQKH